MSNLTNSGEDAVKRQVTKDEADHYVPITSDNIDEVYCIERCAKWIISNGLNKVALQFPLEFSQDAPLVYLSIVEKTGIQDAFIIFASSAARCCISQKDAEYRAAEGIIQFGYTCLTAVPRIHVFRVMAPHWRMDLPKVIDGICSAPLVKEIIDARKRTGSSQKAYAQNVSLGMVDRSLRDPALWKKHVVVLYDTRLHYTNGDLLSGLQQHLPRRFSIAPLLVAMVNKPNEDNANYKFINNRKNHSSECITKDKLCNIKDSEFCSVPCLNKYIDEAKFKDLRWNSFDVKATACQQEEHALNGIGVDDSGIAMSTIPDPQIKDDDNESEEEKDPKECFPEHFIMNGRFVHYPSSGNINDLIFVYIGRPGPTLTSMALRWPQHGFYVIDPITGESTSTNAAKIIMQRNFKLEQIKDANTIGLLISNYYLPNFQSVLDRLIALVKSAGKKCFVQYSAHPDLPKLLNTPNIDIFVYIACPESTIVRREIDPELYKVLAAPWELEVALNPNQKWNLSFETNYQELLSEGRRNVPMPEARGQDESVSVSLINNRLQSLGIREDVETEWTPIEGASSGAVAIRSGQELVDVLEGSRRGLLWGERTWRGLDPEQESSVPEGGIVEGRRGIAGGYTEEGKM